MAVLEYNLTSDPELLIFQHIVSEKTSSHAENTGVMFNTSLSVASFSSHSYLPSTVGSTFHGPGIHFLSQCSFPMEKPVSGWQQIEALAWTRYGLDKVCPGYVGEVGC